ncbi:MAG: histidine--tRNA ligase [Bacilli bacterium]|nr:histidine--tRNA ligase [Bacilli bacterium]
MKLMNVKGTSDSLPNKEIVKRRVINTLTNTFETFGYLPLDTTILCYYDLLASKYSGGSEILKEVYTLKDQGDRDLGLRYDLTVPFAKVISMNAGRELTLPFKRYEVGKVFRDGPVKTGRAREFYQCDVDVCGIEGAFIEAEMLSMTSLAYKKLGIDIYIEVNNRKLLEGFIIDSEIPSNLTSNVILSVDKLAKIGEDGVRRELEQYNIEEEKLNKLFSYFKCGIEDLDNMNITNESFIEGRKEIQELFGYIKELNITECKFSPYLARGLEIYTGTVWEVFDKKQRLTCAIGGGGRFDKIITNFINDGNSYPAVGISFGIVPICEILEETQTQNTYDLLIVPLDTNIESLKLANKLREKGIKVVVEMTGRKIKKTLESASKNNVPYVIVLGDSELKDKSIEIKDMKNSTTTKISIDNIEEIYNFIKR